MLTLISCPTCHHKFSVPESSMGHRRTCPNCEAIFVAGKSVAESNGKSNGARRGLLERAGEEDRSAKPPLDRTMLAETAQMIRYNCPRCKKPLESPTSEAGTKKPCPACGGRLQVPAAPAPVQDPNLNKTLLATAEGSAPPPFVPTPATPMLVSSAPAAASAPAQGKGDFLSSRAAKYLIGGLAAAVVLFAVLFFYGKHQSEVEHEKAMKEYEKALNAQKLESEKQKQDILAMLQRQEDLKAQQLKEWKEQQVKQESQQQALRDELRALAKVNDDKQAAEAKARLDQKLRELEDEKKRAQDARERAERDMKDKINDLTRRLDNANQKGNNSTTIIAPPPPPPWYHPYYHRYPW